MLTRRNLLAIAASLPVATLYSRPAAAVISAAVILQATSQALSFLQARGDATLSFAAANQQVLAALVDQVTVLGNAMKDVLVSLEAMRRDLNLTPLKSAEQALYYDLFSEWKTALQLRAGEEADRSNGGQLDALARYHDIRGIYTRLITNRNAYLSVGQDLGFDNAMHVCLIRELESDLCGYLMARGLELARVDLTSFDVVQAEAAYADYFQRATSREDNNALPKFAAATEDRIAKMRASNVLPTFKLQEFLGQGLVPFGCHTVKVEINRADLRRREHHSIRALISVRGRTGDAEWMAATLDEDPSVTVTRPGDARPRGCTFPKERVPSPKVYRWMTEVDNDVIAQLRASDPKLTGLSDDQLAIEHLNRELARFYSATADSLAVRNMIDCIKLSQKASACRLSIFKDGDAGCVLAEL